MNKFKIVLIAVTCLLFSTGCSYSTISGKSVTEMKMLATERAKEYILEKYDEKFNITDIEIEGPLVSSKFPWEKTILPGEVTLTNGDYEVKLNVESDNIRDNKFEEEIKKDLIDKLFEDKELLGSEYKIAQLGVYDSVKDALGVFLKKDEYYDGDIDSFLKNKNYEFTLWLNVVADDSWNEENKIEKAVEFKQKLDKVYDKIQLYFGSNPEEADYIFGYTLFKSKDAEKYVGVEDFNERENYIYSDTYISAFLDEKTEQYLYEKDPFKDLGHGISVKVDGCDNDHEFEVIKSKVISTKNKKYSLDKLVEDNPDGVLEGVSLDDAFVYTINDLTDCGEHEEYSVSHCIRFNKDEFENKWLVDDGNTVGIIEESKDCLKVELSDVERDKYSIYGDYLYTYWGPEENNFIICKDVKRD